MKSIIAFLGVVLAAGTASAQEIEFGGPMSAEDAAYVGALSPGVVRYEEVEEPGNTHLAVVGGLGMADRSTTRTTDDALGSSASPSFSLDTRLHFLMGVCEMCELSHGIAGAFTFVTTPGLRQYIGDLGYSPRIMFPCMSDEDTQVYLSGILAVSGAGMVQSGDSRQGGYQDHAALGFRLGTSLDVVYDHFLIGLGLDLRQLYGIATQHDRDFLLTANLRLGFDAHL